MGFFDIFSHKKKIAEAKEEVKRAVQMNITASKNTATISKKLRLSLGESGSISINKLRNDLSDR